MRKLKKKTNTLKVCVFCGSRNGQHGEFKVLTMKLGRLIASEGWHLIYGGGKTGLMGTLSKTIKDFNGSITSVIPEIFNKEKIINRKVDKIILTRDIFARKEYMIREADFFIVLPGGLGTFDEIFEILSLDNIGIINKPIIFLNFKKYWLPLKAFLKHAEKNGFLYKKNKENIKFTASIDKTIEFIKRNM